MNLLHYQKPGRYINSEFNSVHKKASLSVGLAFPDIYDVGMSHLGLKILYDIINRIPYASAERIFSPWPDLESAMRQQKEPLSSLESAKPISSFDIIGFSLQYELSYTTVLNMIDLGQMPLRSEDRLSEMRYPLIIAGGPCTVNPYPMEPFIDAFLIGDGEEAIVEILSVCHDWKKSGSNEKTELLRALANIEGVLVPSAGRGNAVRRRYIDSLDDAPFPSKTVVPFTNIIHDRVNIEISRGCTMGCRFCQAGMIYRPVRERKPDTVLAIASEAICSTGYDTVSFTSLSSGDYSCLGPLMNEFNKRFSSQRVSLSLPSLRVGSVNEEMLKELRAVRKAGFTIAPEAGTDRLRAVINKDFTSEIYASALEKLFRAGWQNLKLYFMIGLPTETDEDIAAISDMVLQAIKTSKRITGRNVALSVGVSPFVPKPHTPFQWYGQNSFDLINEKNRMVKTALLKRGVQFRGHNPEMSLLEAAFARGDESLSSLIEEAWRLGCRLDAWTEYFDMAKWQQAGEITGLNAADFAEKSFSFEDRLPWDDIDIGVTKKYLWKEYQKAVAAEFTSDCRSSCHACGLKCRPEDMPQHPGVTTISAAEKRPYGPESISVRARLQYSKKGRLRYLSHLETTTAIIRGMRRAGFPFKYTEGFHPGPKVSFGPALSVGTSGLKEYMDIELVPPFDIRSGLLRLQESLPEGLYADRMQAVEKSGKSLTGFVVRYKYEIKSGDTLSIDAFIENKDMSVERKKSSYIVKDMVENVEQTGANAAVITVKDLGDIKVRLDELLPLIFGRSADDLEITRLSMYGWDNVWKEPLEE